MAVLAQYSIRSKQDYIFRTNRLIEIVGASVIIRDAWDMLFQCAGEMNLANQRAGENTTFSLSKVEKAFKDNTLKLVELFCGGGNETLLIDSKETFISLNRKFSSELLDKYPGIVPMAVCVDATGDYSADYIKLMKKSEIEKNIMVTELGEDFVLPFSMMDRDTWKPVTRTRSIDNNKKRLSEESFAKVNKGLLERDMDKAVKYLDDMVTQKGEESLLAIVHADGNNMGAKIQKMLGNRTDYDECVALMRRFTWETAKAFGEYGLKAVEKKQSELAEKSNDKARFAYRVVVKDGDDMTFICNARYAFEYTVAYLKAVQEYKSDWDYSSCAGITIFHSHYPVAKAYELAEQACDNAKKMVHKTDPSGKVITDEASWIDFHYIHSGTGGNLEEIRERHNTSSLMARPWRVTGKGNSLDSYEKLNEISDVMYKHHISRTNIKEIGNAVENSLEEGYRELTRLCGHADGLSDDLKYIFRDKEDRLIRALYDFSEVYDLWFRR